MNYDGNRNAWMTREIFSNWLISWDRKLTKEKRKIFLLVDNCSAHNFSNKLSAIKLEYLPPNTTAILQPLDQGIIQGFKVNYRKQLLRKIIALLMRRLSLLKRF